MKQFIDSSLEPALWFAADWSLRWAALLAFAALLLWVFRPRRAAVRQMFLLAALTAGLLVPIGPRWGSGWERHQQPERLPLPSFPRSAWERTSGRSASRPTKESDATQNIATGRSHTERGNESVLPGEGSQPQMTSEPLGFRRLIVLGLIVCWIIAVLWQLVRRVCGWLYLRRLWRESVAATEDLADLFAACRADLGVRRPVGLATHPRVRSPILFGLLRLRIIVPRDWPQRNAASQRAGLLHELTHVRRRDHWLAPFLATVQITFFFHPLVRWLLGRLEHEREIMCDEMVVRLGIDRRDYARLLVELARTSGRLAWVSIPLPMSRRRTVKGRIYHLLEEDMEHWIRPLSTRWAVVSGAELLALMLGLASYRVWAVESEQPKTEAKQDKPAKGEIKKGTKVDKPFAARFRRDALRYGGKDFNEWRQNLLTELKGSIRVDGMKAFAAFGANGYAAEATEAILDLMRGYDTTNPRTQDDDGAVVWAGYGAIRKIGADAVPALTKAVNDKNRNVRRFAVYALGSLGTDARSALPEILQAMKSSDSKMQQRAIDAVAVIDPNAKGVVEILIEILKGKNVDNRLPVMNLLKHIGPEARPAIPALIAVLDDKRDDVRIETVRALRASGAGKEAVVPISRLLRDENFNVRIEAYAFLDELGADAKGAVPELIAVLKARQDGLTGRAIDLLWQIGPEAKEAVPALNELLRSDSAQLRKSAVEALTKISPDKMR